MNGTLLKVNGQYPPYGISSFGDAKMLI